MPVVRSQGVGIGHVDPAAGAVERQRAAILAAGCPGRVRRRPNVADAREVGHRRARTLVE